ASLVVQDSVADPPGATVDGDTVIREAATGRGPKIGAGWPRSNAPRSGAFPLKLSSLMFGNTAPASTAGHPACSVMTCGGTGAGGGLGTLNVSKQLSFAIRTPSRSSPVPAASDGTSG